MRDLDPRRLCGQLILGGFDGALPSPTFANALARGERGGAILFKRNVDHPAQVARLNAALAQGAPEGKPPILAVDQEGGRVARLRAPLVSVPPMRDVAKRGGAALVAQVAKNHARELRALGFTMNFAPVLDVDSRASNPIIGDRAFSEDPALVAACGEAYVRALQAGGIAACGKHFPGHGDTAQDSHHELPSVDADAALLDARELAPFRAAIGAGALAIMTAHVVYPALDPSHPATLSRAICTDLLRGKLGFGGVVISDDLEMKAIHVPIEQAAPAAIEAGCDLLLVCSDEDLQERAVAALAARAASDPAFFARCQEAGARADTLRRAPAPILDTAALQAVFDDGEARALREALS